MGGEQWVDIMEMIQLSIPGVSVTYQGEEIGMTDYELTWAETVDPAACLRPQEVFQQYTRDPARTPFQWDSSSHAGFTNYSKPWLPVSTSYETVNVEVEQRAEWSHLKVFNALMQLRESKDFQNCHYTTAVLGNNVFAILRSGPDIGKSEVFVTVVNLSNETSTANVVQLIDQYKMLKVDKLSVAVQSVLSKRSKGYEKIISN